MRRALAGAGSYGLAAAIALGFAPTAHAQREPAGGFLVSASGGYLGLNFPDTARAVFDSTGGGTFGGEVGYVLGRHLTFTASARIFRKEGQRVFVADRRGTVFKLGHPLELQLVPVQLTVGWRFGQQRLFGVPFTPYLGIGGGVTSYREESTVAGERREFSVSKASGHALAGLEVGGGRLRFGIEGGYASVPDAIGDSPDGVSKIYNEDDIGGVTVLGKIVFTTSKR